MANLLLLAGLTIKNDARSLWFRVKTFITADPSYHRERVFVHNGTTVRFVGVHHCPRTLARHGPLLEDLIKRGDKLVLEADERTLRDLEVRRRFPLDDDATDSILFYRSLNKKAAEHGKEVHCFESEGAFLQPFGYGDTHDEVSERLNALFSIYKLLREWSFFSLVYSVYDVIANQPSTLGLLSAGLSSVVWLFTYERLFDYFGDKKRRELRVAAGINDLIERESPGEITVVYGDNHIDHTIAYMEHPELLTSEARNYGLLVNPLTT